MVVLVEFSSPFYERRMAHAPPFCRRFAVWLWKTPLHAAIYKRCSLLCFDETCNRDAMLLVASQLRVLQQGLRVRRGHASKLCIRRYYAK